MTQTRAKGGLIANNIAAASQKKPSPGSVMNKVIEGGLQKQFETVLRDKAPGFVASLIDLYSSDSSLAECEAPLVAREALKAASLDLPINKQLGFAYIVPYNKKPTFQLGYRGYVQLCQRTGAYRYINAGPVYEGELVKQDKLTGELDLTGEKESDTVVGYFAFIETLNGFRKSEYWTVDRVRKHAQRHSKAYDNGPWQEFFDEMATKTVLRNLLSKYGIMSVEMQNAYVAESVSNADAAISSGDADDALDTIDADYSVGDGAESASDASEEHDEG